MTLEITLLGGTLADVDATCTLGSDTVQCSYPSRFDSFQPAEETVPVFEGVESATITIYSCFTGDIVTELEFSELSEANQKIIKDALENEFDRSPMDYAPEYD